MTLKIRRMPTTCIAVLALTRLVTPRTWVFFGLPVVLSVLESRPMVVPVSIATVYRMWLLMVTGDCCMENACPEIPGFTIIIRCRCLPSQGYTQVRVMAMGVTIYFVAAGVERTCVGPHFNWMRFSIAPSRDVPVGLLAKHDDHKMDVTTFIRVSTQPLGLESGTLRHPNVWCMRVH